MKIITCLTGSIYDVVVDLRPSSPTYLEKYHIYLTSTQPLSLCIPEGFAHGFQTMVDNTELLYLHTQPYSQEHEDGINPLDPTLSINWPLPISEISHRDQNHPMLSNTADLFSS